mgnify:FL=1
MSVYTIVYDTPRGDMVSYIEGNSRLYSFFSINDAMNELNLIKTKIKHRIDGSPKKGWFGTIRQTILASDLEMWNRMLTTIRVISTDLTEVI